MRIILVTADSKKEAAKNCKVLSGFTPEVVIKIHTPKGAAKSYLCYESAKDVK
jgi:hypothetical protein